MACIVTVQLKEGPEYYVDHYIDGRRIRERIGKSLAKAKAFLKVCEAKKVLRRKAARGRGDDTAPLDAMKSLWLEHQELRCKPRTVGYYREALKQILPAIPARTVAQLTTAMVESYATSRLRGHGTKKKLSARTINSHVGTLKSMLRWAVVAGMIPSNPLDRLRPLKQRERKYRRALSPVEVRRLLDASPECYRRIWAFMLGTGCRRSEVQGLLWEDVDLDRGLYFLSAAKSKNNEEASNPIPESVLRMLRKHRAEWETDRRAARRRLKTLTRSEGRKPFTINGAPAVRSGEPFTVFENLHARADRGHVFVNALGLPWTVNLRRKLRSCVRAAEIPEAGVDLHSLRVTYVTELIRQGVDIKTVQRLARHKCVRMTLEIYARSFPEDRRQAVEKLSFFEPESVSETDKTGQKDGKPESQSCVA